MAEKVIVLVQDDWEIRGNGTGNVADLQYLPSLFLLDLARELGFRVTFMAEVMQQLAMRRFAARDRNLRIQAELWEDCLRLYRDRGHDVQLHVHPHWHEADFREGFFRLARNWNLATYPADRRRRILAEAIGYLHALLRPDDPEYSVHSFKAGSWGLQPSGGVLRDLEAAGIRFLTGAGRGIAIHNPEFYADYGALEEDLLPYHPDYDDVQKVAGSSTPLVVLPLPYYTLTLRGALGKARTRLLRSLRRGSGEPNSTQPSLPRDVATNAPLISTDARTGFRALRNFRADRSLDIGGGDFRELRFALDQIMARCLGAAPAAVPLVIQGHTKGFAGRRDDVARFFRYMVERYGPVIEFMTMTEFRDALPGIAVLSRSGVAR
jgi:hypothetical protein